VVSIAPIGLDVTVTVYRGFREIVRLPFVESTVVQGKDLDHNLPLWTIKPRTFDR